MMSCLTKAIPGTLQEGGAPFHTTHWTVILQAAKPDEDEAARKALATFSETYWPPLYTFVRRRGYSPADAQDVVQGFFQHVLEKNTLSRAEEVAGNEFSIRSHAGKPSGNETNRSLHILANARIARKFATFGAKAT